MNTHDAHADVLWLEPGLRAKLERLALGGHQSEMLLARIAWSRLAEPGDGTAGALLSGLGPDLALRLLIEGVSPSRLDEVARGAGVELSRRALSEGLARWQPRLDRASTLADIDQALAYGLRVTAPDLPHWPSALEDLGTHSPIMLWLKGNPALLNTPALSVVGARAATNYGTHITAEIVGGVCQTGLTIISGAAYGIDAVAHRTALALSSPTVAVLAGGADRPYPAAHDSLLNRISETGLICAEMIPGAAPTKWRFRMRNRIIAALSPATLVTEAGVRSGTLNTAGHAAELGRMLGAVPGPVSSAASAGCHRLIREYGATLVTSAREACELLGMNEQLDLAGEAAHYADQGGSRPPALHERMLDALPLRGGRSLSDLVKRAGMSASDARGALAELELLGRVYRRSNSSTHEELWGLKR